MSDEKSTHNPKQSTSKAKSQDFAIRIGNKATRKLKAKRNGTSGVWFGLGMMGLVGWAIVVPTLLGAAIGVWLDKHFPGDHSWTLSLLVAGLTLGCFNAWRWIDKETQTLREEQDGIEPKQEEQKQNERR
jgi:ATP synthase protein I